MPITPFLRDQVFSPELLKSMGDAFTEACKELGLTDREDGMAELVARQIITLAQRGITTKTGLYLMTVHEFKTNAQ